MEHRLSRTLSLAACLSFVACGGGGGSGDGAGGSPAPSCPESAGPTIHDTDILADETWSAEGSPHVISVPIKVREGATLTIEPCVEVRLADGVSLGAGTTDGEGTIRAEGTADGPILFTADGAGPWEALQLIGGGKLYLSHTTLEKGGLGSPNNGHAATIRGLARSEWDPARLEIHDVTIRGSVGLGIDLEGPIGFVPGSEGLTITGSGSGDEENVYPLAVNAAGLHLIPTGSYTGNGKDEILVYTWDPVETEVTVRDVGVPYRITPYPQASFDIAGSDGKGILTLEAGVTFRFEAGMELRVATGAGEPNGALRLIGTAEDPVVLTSASDTPAAGDWMGIKFNGDTVAAETRFEHARISYAGGDCNCSGGYGCNPGSTGDEAALLFFGTYATQPFMFDTVIAHSAGHAVNRAWRTDQSTVSIAEGNEFESIANCIETALRSETNACPDPIVCAL